ncbi:MAG TPA: histone deacetylase [Candidatus Binataceae bacterium]|nr:histone deacetylase [Candidatus Binataceae bacterium]
MHKTVVVIDRSFTRHFPGKSHPERPERISAMIDMLDGFSRPGMVTHLPRPATLEEIALCHDQNYIAAVADTATMDRFVFDADTRSSRDSFATATLAAGAVLTAIEAVADGAAENSFAMVRPPGHHALPNRAMGFCFFNNIAIGAQWLINHRNIKRVMIIDWDLHHGNGTQAMFYDTPELLYASMHQYPFYPGTGSLSERGAGEGLGYTINAPIPAGFGDPEYLRIFDDLIMPIGRAFKPEFILISAGFDCHYLDPLGAMLVTEAGFAQMTRRIRRLAAECCGAKTVAVLEGGYDLQALANSSRSVLEEFGYEADEKIESLGDGGDRAIPIIEKARQGVGQYWNLT